MIDHFVGVPKIVFQDRIRQRTFEQFADIPALRVVKEPVFKVLSHERVQQQAGEQDTEVPKISSKDQIFQLNQILDVPVPPMMEQLREVLKMVSRDRIQPWTAEQIVDMPVLEVVEEHVEITKVSPQNRERISECSDEQGVDVTAGQMAGGVPVSRRHG